MKQWVGAAIVASICAIAAPASATAGGQTLARSQQAEATDLSAQRDRSHHSHHIDRAYGPYVHYLARPYYYRPYPYAAPAPFSFGFGFGPYW